MDREPTDAEIKEFWEWCGFKRLPNRNRDYHFEVTTKVMDWQAPDDTTMPYFPRIDLNNLFKWAVPRLNETGKKIRMLGQKKDKQTYFCSIGGNNLPHSYIEDKDPTLVLFWAIWQVIKEY